MNSYLRTSFVAVALLCMGAGADAQNRRDREPLDHVRADLERAAHDMYYLSNSEMKRFNHVRQEIAEFQGKWESGRYDKHELDEVIGGLQSVVDKNRLQPRDRDRLFSDLIRLREFRSRLR